MPVRISLKCYNSIAGVSKNIKKEQFRAISAGKLAE
jgi:hypothetical protein